MSLTARKRARVASNRQSLNLKKKKKYLRTSDFDIDNYVMPYGMAVTPALPDLEDSAVDIQTPSWRIVEEGDGLLYGSDGSGEVCNQLRGLAGRHVLPYD